MSTIAKHEYLATEVMTAAPQKLQLMLIEAAIRFGERARGYWAMHRDEEAGEALSRCQEIVAELIGGLNFQDSSPLVRRVAGVYLFIYRALIMAHTRRDEAKLSEALSVLAVESETWRQVCNKLGSTVGPEAPHLGMNVAADHPGGAATRMSLEA